MRLKPEQLPAHLAKPLLPVYLVSGDIPLLTQETCERLKSAAQKVGYASQPSLEAGASFDWQEFHISAHSLSLFSSKAFLQLNLGERLPKPEVLTKNLLNAINAAHGDKILVITVNKLDTRLQNADWVKAIDKKGAIIQIWPISTEQLPGWLNQRMRVRGLSADMSDIQFIADCVDGNLLAAAQAVEKLYLLYGSHRLSTDEIADSLSDSSQFDTFQWVTYALQANTKKLIHCVYRLRTDNSEPILLLWTIARELRRLIALLNALEAEHSIEKSLDKEKVWKKHYPLYKRCLPKMRKADLEKLLAQIHTLDLIIKGAAPGDIWNELLMFGLKLARLAA